MLALEDLRLNRTPRERRKCAQRAVNSDIRRCDDLSSTMNMKETHSASYHSVPIKFKRSKSQSKKKLEVEIERKRELDAPSLPNPPTLSAARPSKTQGQPSRNEFAPNTRAPSQPQASSVPLHVPPTPRPRRLRPLTLNPWVSCAGVRRVRMRLRLPLLVLNQLRWQMRWTPRRPALNPL